MIGKPWTTRALLAAKAQGAVIRVHRREDDDNHGRQVVYDPEKPRDYTPWRLVRGEDRCPAAECRPEGLHGGPWELARKLRI